MMNEWDPMALVGFGSPEDEYDEHTAKVLAILHRSKGNMDICRNELKDYLRWLDADTKELEIVSKGEFSPTDSKHMINKIIGWFNEKV